MYYGIGTLALIAYMIQHSLLIPLRPFMFFDIAFVVLMIIAAVSDRLAIAIYVLVMIIAEFILTGDWSLMYYVLLVIFALAAFMYRQYFSTTTQRSYAIYIMIFSILYFFAYYLIIERVPVGAIYIFVGACTILMIVFQWVNRFVSIGTDRFFYSVKQ